MGGVKRIDTLEGVKDLFAIPDVEPSDTEKAWVRKVFRDCVDTTTKVKYNDWFITLDRDEQEKLQTYWGFK